jgi:hypothetical protein
MQVFLNTPVGQVICMLIVIPLIQLIFLFGTILSQKLGLSGLSEWDL